MSNCRRPEKASHLRQKKTPARGGGFPLLVVQLDITEQERIKRQNEQQSAQGIADAMAGKEQDPALSDDLDYSEAWQRAAGRRHGTTMSQDFLERLSELEATADVDGFLDEFIRSEFGPGTGSPTFDAHMLTTFRQQVEPHVVSFKKNRFKVGLQQGRENLAQAIHGKVEGSWLSVCRCQCACPRCVFMFSPVQ